jgi:hypothetical protein
MFLWDCHLTVRRHIHGQAETSANEVPGGLLILQLQYVMSHSVWQHQETSLCMLVTPVVYRYLEGLENETVSI